MTEKRILIIDDERDFAEMVKLNLEDGGKYEVAIETRGERALPTAIEFKPDLILLDIRIPDKDGIEVLDELKKNSRTIAIPVIMLSALDSRQAKDMSLAQYNEEYITKPVTDKDLKEKIDEVLRRRRGGRLSTEDFIVTKEIDKSPEHSEKAKKSESKEEFALPAITILVVDDEKPECDLLTALLKSRGFETYSCWKPEQAMSKIIEVTPDILILDLVMPDVSGMDILKDMKKLKLKSKIVVVTGVKDPVVIKDVLGLGADDIVVKPYSIDQIHVTLTKHIAKIGKGA